MDHAKLILTGFGLKFRGSISDVVCKMFSTDPLEEVHSNHWICSVGNLGDILPIMTFEQAHPHRGNDAWRKKGAPTVLRNSTIEYPGATSSGGKCADYSDASSFF